MGPTACAPSHTPLSHTTHSHIAVSLSAPTTRNPSPWRTSLPILPKWLWIHRTALSFSVC
eukprot:4165273-Alexandrium_andersonii.AAC.1